MRTQLPSSLSFSAPIPDAIKKKRVLLIDTSHAKRDLRADALRKFGIDVDCAADVAEARSWWRPAFYNLVLVNLDKERGQCEKFCYDVRSANPPQRLAFLVGKPEYLADSPNPNQEWTIETSDGGRTSLAARVLSPEPGGFAPRWGILQASRQISSVRSASIARINAVRNLPPPPRDLEGRREKSATSSTSLDDLLKKEEL